MSTLCAITGTLRDLTGTVLTNTQVTFVRAGVAGQDGSTIVPRIVKATSDISGVLAITLYAGNYTATTVGADTGIVTFSVAVPATATAVLSDLIDAAPTTVTPQAVIDAQAARDAAAASASAAAADRTQTGLDAAATAADRVQTGQDSTATATAAASTSADRTQTGLDKAAAAASASNAAASAAQAALAAGYGPIIKNDNILTGNLTLAAGFNGMSVGPIEIAAGVILTIDAGSIWAII